MSSEPRIDVDGAWHHVMNRGHNRQPIFRSESDCEAFTALLTEVTGPSGIEIHSYALMSNHFHLMVHTPTAGLGNAMQYLEGVYAIRFNRKYGREGALFRGRYRSVLLDSESHFLEVPRYIDNNPVKAGLVADPADYRWSSYRVLAYDRVAPSFLSTHTLVPMYFGGDPHAYRSFVAERHDHTTTEYESCIKSRLGDIQLAQAVAEYRTAIATAPTAGPAHAIECYVANVCDVSRHTFRLRGQANHQDSCALVLALLYRHGISSPTALAVQYGFASRSGVTTAIRRIERKAAEHPELGEVLERGLRLPLQRAA